MTWNSETSHAGSPLTSGLCVVWFSVSQTLSGSVSQNCYLFEFRDMISYSILLKYQKAFYTLFQWILTERYQQRFKSNSKHWIQPGSSHLPPLCLTILMCNKQWRYQINCNNLSESVRNSCLSLYTWRWIFFFFFCLKTKNLIPLFTF